MRFHMRSPPFLRGSLVLISLNVLGCSEECPRPHRYDLDTYGYPICDSKFTTRLIGTFKGASIERTLETTDSYWDNTPDGRRCFVDFLGPDERKAPDAKLTRECLGSSMPKDGTPIQGSIRFPDDPTVYTFRKGSMIHYPWSYYVDDVRFLMVLDVGTLMVCTDNL